MSDTALHDASNDPSPNPEEIDLECGSLEAGESIQWASTPHKYSLVGAFAVGIPLSVVLIGIPIVVAAYLQYTNTNYVITNRGLYSKRGILSRDVQQIGFDKIQNFLPQSALGSYFGFGSVDVSTAGGSGVELQLRSIPDPASGQELIARAVDKRQQGESESTANDVLDEILQELRLIRNAMADDAIESTDTATDVASNERSTTESSADDQ